MKIVLDTTVFENGFNSRSADVQLLKTFLSSGRSQLAVPSVVREEAVNRVRKRAEDADVKMNALHRLTGDDRSAPRIDVELIVSNYERSLEEFLRDLGASVLPYPPVTHEALTRRALAPSKPFVEGGRGYRDALIWYSLLELAQSQSEDIVFLSGNVRDWCEGPKAQVFHHGLLEELTNLGIPEGRLRFLPNLSEFNERYAVGKLQLEPPQPGPDSRDADYLQLLTDGEEAIKSDLFFMLPQVLPTIVGDEARLGDFGLIGLNGPANVKYEPPRLLDSQRRLLQFSADYRVALDVFVPRGELSTWKRLFAVQQCR